MWLLTGKTLYFFTVLLSGSGSFRSPAALFKAFPEGEGGPGASPGRMRATYRKESVVY